MGNGKDVEEPLEASQIYPRLMVRGAAKPRVSNHGVGQGACRRSFETPSLREGSSG